MYYLCCTLNPDEKPMEHIEPGTEYEDSFGTTYLKQINQLDRFIHLLDMFKIIENSTNLIKEMPIVSEVDYWKISKLLIDYVNAIFCFKEYVRSYRPLYRKGKYNNKEVIDKLYNNKTWYRFINEYRDIVIHRGLRISDYRSKCKDFYINIDLLQTELNDPHSDQRQSDRLKRMLDIIDNHLNCIKIIDEKKYLSIKYVAENVYKEIDSVKDEILLNAFEYSVKPAVEWFISKIYKNESCYMYTYVINKENPQVYFEPNYTVEDFYKNMIKILGDNHDFCLNIKSLLNSKDYRKFYN